MSPPGEHFWSGSKNPSSNLVAPSPIDLMKLRETAGEKESKKAKLPNASGLGRGNQGDKLGEMAGPHQDIISRGTGGNV